MVSSRVDKDKARYISKLALDRGELVKKPCEVCGEKKVDMHHLDYGDPMNIMWLCQRHHSLWHERNEKLPGISKKRITLENDTDIMFHLARIELSLETGIEFTADLFVQYLIKDIAKRAKSRRRNLQKQRKQNIQ